MSEDRFSVVSQQSWLGRIGGAIKGVLVGLCLFIVAFPLLFWNEGRSVRQYQTLLEGAGLVVSVPSDKVDAANDGKLVHATGNVSTEATLEDPEFGVSAKALKLRRVVEMYQWREESSSHTEKKLGGGSETATTYTYDKVWSEDLIRSADFKKPEGHQNPGSMAYQTTEQLAAPITLGAFTLPPSLAGEINHFEPLPLAADAPPAESFKGRFHDAGLYLGSNPASPQIGDLRIRFEVAPFTAASVMARQAGQTFGPFQTKAGNTIEMLQTGTHGPGQMIRHAQDSNRLLTWGLRLGGFIVMFIGLGMLFRPLSILADVVPILGSIVGAGTGLVSLLLAAALSLVTIASAWVVYRPLIGIALLAAAIAVTMLIKGRLRTAKSAGMA